METNPPTTQPGDNGPGVLPPPEAAKYLGMSKSWLAKDRTSGHPPVVPFIKLGRRVVYSVTVLRRIAEGR